ncbi:methyltransferase domain-containing protein [Ktedonosporobacter rubrisoli]|uniref:Methyltransferase domain-containing protein n=1 Tax=Ktedonosporobacter rubrisoli TaxID=2509675 RepID=A0A4P6JLV2_KTERU|nr:methyltransferase domain-containing protein [Ktedonosporobacter rubrisoli]QBD76195.1 methyltransferase domain-containing protein [Ktedonosporobacter rubrisoli]
MNSAYEPSPDSVEVKTCCSTLYQSDIVRFLLGDSFHPGGIQLTEHLGTLLQLAQGQRMLDIASGQGKSAIALAQRFGCQVQGIEYGAQAVQRATEAAAEAGVAHLVTFQQGDAERLPVAAETFDVVICECAFCTFTDKSTAASEMWRVLKSGGRVGLSDLTRLGDVPEELQSFLAWIACLADAQPVDNYTSYLTQAGLAVDLIEEHNEALYEMVQQIRGKLLGAELLVRLKKLDLPASLDFTQAKSLARAALTAIQMGRFGYIVMSAHKAT